ncbi:MAG: DedA family protein [Gemmatimonadaceae bacterium]
MLHFAQFIDHYGYIAVALLVAIESMGVPLPGETAVITAAAFAATGELSVIGVAIAGTIGTVIGGTGGYWLGRRRGNALLARYGHWLWLNDARLERAESYFRQHGMKTVFFGRYVVLLRIIGSLLAGMMHMPFGRFSIVNFAGGALWAVTFTVLGYLFGENLPRLHRHLGEGALVVTVVVMVAGMIYWTRLRARAVS